MTCACCCPCDCTASNFNGSKVTLTSNDCADVICENSSPSVDGDYYYSFRSGCLYSFVGSSQDCTYEGAVNGNPATLEVQINITVECIDDGPEWTVTVTLYTDGVSIYGDTISRLCVVNGHLVGECDVDLLDDIPAFVCTVHLVFS
jgi:hypothetical protein